MLRKATFVEFEISDYALLVNEKSATSNNAVALFSNGDVDGDGEIEDINALDKFAGQGGDYKSRNNWSFSLREWTTPTTT